MFRIATIALALSFAAPSQAAVPTELEPHAPFSLPAEDEATLEVAVKLELKVIEGVIGVMADYLAESESRPLDDDAREAHERASELFAEANVKASAGDDYEAYRLLHKAWSTHQPATQAFAEHAPKAAVEEMVSGLLGGFGTHLAELRTTVDTSGNSVASQAFGEAQELYDSAKESQAAGDDKEALGQARRAIGKVDEGLRSVVKGTRSGKRRAQR